MTCGHDMRACAAAPQAHTEGEMLGASPPPAISDIKVSFLIIAYVEKKYQYFEIADCLQSIRDQTDDAWEIVLVHDGPNPIVRALWQDTRDAMRKGRQSRIRYIEAPYRGDRGGHASVEVAKHQARGEFVCVLNGDNKVRREYVEKMYRPDADIVTCQVLMRDMPGVILSGRGFMRGRIDRLNYMIRASVARQVPHKMHIDADYDWLIDCWDAANSIHPVRVVHIDETLGEHK